MLILLSQQLAIKVSSWRLIWQKRKITVLLEISDILITKLIWLVLKNLKELSASKLSPNVTGGNFPMVTELLFWLKGVYLILVVPLVILLLSCHVVSQIKLLPRWNFGKSI